MRDFLFYITDEQGRSYTVENGVVIATAVRTPLEFEPTGTKDILIAWERDMKQLGLVRNFSLPLGFVLDGGQIMRHVFYTRNIEEKLYLVIQKLHLDATVEDYNWQYKYFYKGELDLSTIKDEGERVTCSIMEGGLQKLSKANGGTTQEIPFDTDAIKVRVDGIYLSEKHNFLVPDVQASDSGNPFHLIGASVTTTEGAAAGFASFSVFYEDLPDDGGNPANVEIDFNNDIRYLFTTTQAITGITLTGKLKVRGCTNTSAFYSAFLRTSTGRTIALGNTPLNNRTEIKDIAINVTLDAEAGEKFWMIGRMGGFFTGVEYYETTFEIGFQSKYKTTYIDAHLPKVLGDKLSEKVGGAPGLLSSAVLESSDIAITCGDAIRGIKGAVIKTDFNKFLDFAHVEHATGFAIEQGRFVIEPYAHFLDFATTTPLGETKDYPHITPATDLLVNTIKIGYAEKQVDDVNGKFEYNNTHLYRTPITRIVKELNLVCPYYAQSYAIELLRINLEGKTTTDNGSDNDTFLLQIDRANPISFIGTGFFNLTSPTGFLFTGSTELLDSTQELLSEGTKITLSGTVQNNRTFTVTTLTRDNGGLTIQTQEPVFVEFTSGAIGIATNIYNLKREVFDTIEGLPVDSRSFNIGLSPKRLLLKHLPYINSVLHGFAGQKLIFKTTERNRNLKTVKGVEIIDEDADEVIGSNILFIPKYAEFENIVPVDLVDIKEATPNRGFDFTIDGISYKGLDIKCGLAPSSLKEQAFKILFAPDSDLKNLL